MFQSASYVYDSTVSKAFDKKAPAHLVNESVDTPMVSHDFFSVDPTQAETQSNNPLPPPTTVDEECESMDSTNSNDGDAVLPKPESSQCCYPVIFPTYISPFVPFSIPFWPGQSSEPPKSETHEVLKPTPVHSKSPINVDELVGLSKLSLGESLGNSESTSLSLKLHEGSTRQSAFHANPGSGSSRMNSSTSPVDAVVNRGVWFEGL